MPHHAGNLTERFAALWRGIGARSAPLRVSQHILEHYAAPERRYHTIDHIVQALGEFDRARHLARDPAALELAVWLHKVVYNPHADGNAARSAAYAWEILREGDVDVSFADEVARLILLAQHGSCPEPDEDDIDGRLLLDIDLSILGQPQQTYRAYERAIALEFAGVERYHEKRADFLRGVDARRPLYRTEFFRKRFEHEAHHNLARAIEYNEHRAR